MSQLPDRNLGATQKRILQAILKSETPLPVDHLTKLLRISRNATYQHIIALERDGMIEKAEITQTKGRPSQTYQLTEKGQNTFPKHYALLAKLLVALVKNRMGSDLLQDCLVELGGSLAEQYQARVTGLTGNALISEVSNIMKELGYESEVISSSSDDKLEIRAHNCVFHELAKEHEEVCALDLALISKLTGSAIEHKECMVRGGASCRFKIKK